MKQTIGLLITIAALALGGCRDWFPPIDPTDPKGPNDTAYVDPNDDGSAKMLAGTRWCLTTIEGSGIRETVEKLPPRYIEFDGNGGLNGNGGANQFGAKYTARNGVLALADLIQTDILSDPIEYRFFTFLNNANRYAVTGDNLKLYAENAPGILYFEKCDSDPVIDTNSYRQQVPLGQEFKLQYQAAAEIIGGEPGMFITFQGLNSDSRCPANVDCIWEGDASVTMILVQGTDFIGELHTNTSVGPRIITLGGYDVELLELNPLPLLNVPPNPADYVAVLRVTKH